MQRLEKLAFIAFLLVAAGGCVTMQLAERAPDARRMFVATGYCRCGTCCGWHRNWLLRPVYSGGPNRGQRKHVGITASGTRARPGTIAADPVLYPFGTIVHIEGYGYGRVEDTGSAIKGDRVDLYFKTHGEAEDWGARNVSAKVWYPQGRARRR